MAQIQINVAVTPKGKSIEDSVQFAFAPGKGTPSGVLSSDGSIDLSKQYPAGTSVTFVFELTTTTLTFSEGPSVGTFNMSFYGAANGARNACLIAPKGQTPGIYNGSEFVFGPNALGSGYLSLTITDNNSDGKTYAYGLVVWAATDGGKGHTFEDDPRVINHDRNE